MTTPSDLAVLIRKGPGDVEFWNRRPASALDFRFVNAQGRSLPFEIEEFDRQRRTLAAWVRIDAVGWTDRTIHMYYGSGQPVAEAAGEVWARSYAAVWHMNDPAAALEIRDSARDGHHGVLSDGLGTTWKTEGRIGGGVFFDGRSGGVIVADSDTWTFGAGDWSIECWIRPESLQGRNFGILAHGLQGIFQLYLHNTNMLALERRNGAVVNDYSVAGLGLEPGVWSHLVVDRRGPRVRVAVNGEFGDAVTGMPGFEDGDSPDVLTLGSGAYGVLHGVLDEVRVSRSVRPPGWSRATYLAQTGALVKYGPEQQRR